MINLRAYLELARPANVITAWADVLAGIAGAGVLAMNGHAGGSIDGIMGETPLLIAATSGLYAGGVVMNDVFDAGLDATERPERAIPSGRASRTGATIFGLSLLVIGIGAAALASWQSGGIAAFIAIAAILYDRYGKHHALLGPLNMGLCRGMNLLLGVSIVPIMVGQLWFLALLPIIYIAAITAISRGEVHGGSSNIGWMAVILAGIATGSLVVLSYLPTYDLKNALFFIALFAALVLPPFVRAAKSPVPGLIKRAVRSGILGLIPLNAALVAGFAGWPLGVIVLLLLPISIRLAKLFAVT